MVGVQIALMRGAAYSGAMDFLLAILPWAAILNMGMKTTEKLHVAIAMSMGIL